MSDFDGAAYPAARVGAARSLREIEAEAAELGLGPLAGLAGWQAEQLERPTPFTAAIDPGFGVDYRKAMRMGGCYEASFGWVHVRPGCRCAGR